MKTEIIFEDKDILVIYKPAGLATQTAKLGQADVVSELKNYLIRKEREAANGAKNGGLAKGNSGQKAGGSKAGSPYLGVIHRLDQPVEGLLVFAKNKKAAGDLTAQLKGQDGEPGLHKHYYAVLCGKPSGKEGELVDCMYKNVENTAVIIEKGSGKEGCQEAAKAKEARLKYEILEEIAVDGAAVAGGVTSSREFSNGQAAMREFGNQSEAQPRFGAEPQPEEETRLRTELQSDAPQTLVLADIQILTGRFHQIRAQMSHAGLPLLGDLKYGDEAAKELARQKGVRNVALCAYKLEFVHPVTKKKLSFQTQPRGIAFSLCGAHEK